MIYKPEYDRIMCKSLDENIYYNLKEIDLLASFLYKYITKQDNLTGIRQLELLELEK